jgi:hypothetical protein
MPLSRVFRGVVTDEAPVQRKTASITTIYNAGDHRLTESYGSISEVSVVSQILEQIIARKLYASAGHHILPSCQFGFRIGSNVAHAAICLVKSVVRQRVGGMPCAAVFVDLKNAIPSVENDILFDMLHYYGLRATPSELASLPRQR